MSEYERQEPVGRDLGADERSPEAIEREIERTRERMSNNIDALGDKLNPENLKQQAKDAISERAQDVVANVGDQARQTGSRVLDFITENPLPAAAVTLGAIWLFSMRKGGESEVSGDRMARFAYTGPERREPDGRPGLGRRLVDRAGSMRDTVADAASQAGERAGELKERVQERAGELGSSAKERARDARGGLERMMAENPLMVAAGAAVVGLALGMLVPESEKERRILGSKRDELVDRVQETASRVKEVAVEAGREVQETLRDEVNQRGGDVKSTLKEAATTVKEQIKESAGRVAKEAKQEIRKSPQGDTG
jgi:gas vesicle protein